MKKIIIFGAALYLLAGAYPANAGISVDIGLGIPQPTYYEAPVAPVYVAPSYVQYDYGRYRYRPHYQGRGRPHR